jgi:hypothetical protein
MELEVPKRPNLGLIHCHGSTSFAVREAKEVLSLQMSRTMVEKYCFDHFIFLFFFIFFGFCQTFAYLQGKRGTRLGEGQT